MRLTQLANTLTARRWQIDEQTQEEIHARPPRGIERALFGAYILLFTGLVLAGLQLAIRANESTLNSDTLIDLIREDRIDSMIREDGEYIITLDDGSRERFTDSVGTLNIRLEQAGFSPQEIDALPVEIRSDGNDIRLFERLILGVMPLITALSALFISTMLLLSRLKPRREHTFSLNAGEQRIQMQDRRGTWALDSYAEFEGLVRRRSGVRVRVVIVVWLILSLLWYAGSLFLIVVVEGNA